MTTLASWQPLHAWHPVSKSTIVVGLVAAGVLWWTDTGDTGADMSASAASVGAETLVEGGATADQPLKRRVLLPLKSFDAMVERPLFIAGRRPKASPSTLLPTVAIAGPQPLRFVGSIEQNGVFEALVADKSAVRSMRVGQGIDGWTVLAIDRRRLVLGSGANRLELQLLE